MMRALETVASGMPGRKACWAFEGQGEWVGDPWVPYRPQAVTATRGWRCSGAVLPTAHGFPLTQGPGSWRLPTR